METENAYKRERTSFNWSWHIALLCPRQKEFQLGEDVHLLISIEIKELLYETQNGQRDRCNLI